MNGLGNAFERVLSRLFDVQGSAKSQVAQNVKNEVVAPFRQIFGLGPVLAIAINKQVVPPVDVLLDE